MMHVETLLKARYQEIRQRLRNPKDAIVEPKVVRQQECTTGPAPKRKRRSFKAALCPATITLIQRDYEGGIAVSRICAHFGIGARTFRRLRQKHGWGLRPRVKAEGRI